MNGLGRYRAEGRRQKAEGKNIRQDIEMSVPNIA